MKENRFAFISLVLIWGVAGCDHHEQLPVAQEPQPMNLKTTLATIGPQKVQVKKGSTNVLIITGVAGSRPTTIKLKPSSHITITSPSSLSFTVSGASGSKWSQNVTFTAGSIDLGDESIQCTGADGSQFVPAVYYAFN